ncbi:MAG: hypothetical protein AAF664_19995 [Planctomycetota bacterium]
MLPSCSSNLTSPSLPTFVSPGGGLNMDEKRDVDLRVLHVVNGE